MKNFYRRRIVVSLCLMLWTSITFMAQTTITGTVVDKNNEPVPGARVEESGSSEYVVTDIDGTFRIEIPSSATHLKVSYPGFSTMESKIKPDMIVRLGNGWGGKTKGYRGFFDLYGGFSFGNKMNVFAGDLRVIGLSNYMYFGISTTHGYQINRNLFIGAGAGVFSDAMREDTGREAYQSVIGCTIFNIPIYADVRWDFGLAEKTAPFVGIKFGYQLGLNSPDKFITGDYSDMYYLDIYSYGASSFYFQPTIGLRTGIGGKSGINIGLSYYFPVRKRLEGEFGTWEYNSTGIIQIKDLGIFSSSFLMLNFGFDF